MGCYALVYVDGMLMNGPKEPTEPFDVNQIPPDRAEAIEYYDGPSQTPLEYSRMDTKRRAGDLDVEQEEVANAAQRHLNHNNITPHAAPLTRYRTGTFDAV